MRNWNQRQTNYLKTTNTNIRVSWKGGELL